MISCRLGHLEIQPIDSRPEVPSPSQIFPTYSNAVAIVYIESFGWPGFSFITALPSIPDMELM